MARIVNWAAAVLFLALLAAPLASFGVTEQLPSLGGAGTIRLLNAKPDARDRVANILIAESPYASRLIRLKNGFDYHAVGFVNTPQVISGEWPWLYYKQQFDGGRCLPEATYREALASIEAMRLVAAGAGIDLRVSVSPDKAVVYPDKLGLRGTAAAGCKLESAKAWRTLAKASGSSVIDHLEALAKPLAASIQVYDATDTHWNPLGYAYMVDDLAGRLLGRRLPDPYAPDLKAVPIATGIRTFMLELDEPELQLQLSDAWKEAARVVLAPGIGDAVIVHDSFYDRYREVLEFLFPAGRFIYVNEEVSEEMAKAIEARPRLLLVNSVERRFFARFATRSMFGWKGLLGRALLAANADASRACTFPPTNGPDLRMSGLVAGTEPGELVSTSANPTIRIGLPSTSDPICLRITFQAEPQERGRLFLPLPAGFGTAGAIPLEGTGDQTVELILPASLSGQSVELRPVSHRKARIGSLSIAVGSAR